MKAAAVAVALVLCYSPQMSSNVTALIGFNISHIGSIPNPLQNFSTLQLLPSLVGRMCKYGTPSTRCNHIAPFARVIIKLTTFPFG